MNLKHLGRALSIAAIAVPLAGVAQAPAPSAAAPGTAAPPAFATPTPPPPVTPEQRAAIKELLDAMNTRDALTKAYGAISQSLAPRMAEAMNRQIEVNASLSADQKQKMRQNIGPAFDSTVREAMGVVTAPKLVDETMDKMIPIYAKYFTLPEVKQLTAFYRTPLGNKTLSTMAQANNEALQAGAAIFSPRISAIMDKTMKAQFDAAAAPAPAPAPAKK